CGEKIIDRMKPAMLNRGIWAPEDADIDISGQLKTEIPKTSHYGFWINALYSPWRSFSDVAAEFLSSKDTVKELMNFVNSWLAEIWEEKSEETKPEMLVKLCQDYGAGTVPPGVMVLTAGVDVQKDHFYFVIRGWGYHEESWLIRSMRVESWEDIETALLKTSYKSETLGLLTVRLACVDTGYRTSEVYDFCRKWRDVTRPIKGQDHLSGMQYRISHIDRHPRTGAVIPGGLSLYHLDTSYFKDKVTRLVNTEPGALGGWHLYKDVVWRRAGCRKERRDGWMGTPSPKDRNPRKASPLSSLKKKRPILFYRDARFARAKTSDAIPARHRFGIINAKSVKKTSKRSKKTLKPVSYVVGTRVLTDVTDGINLN
ncbi:MAG: phage terminase large subunit family protein, partial [Candidatus Omnitrophica bacterium]|nr:phage terminase large subunit family protein [Candidatus Omnitrophota bacterium]